MKRYEVNEVWDFIIDVNIASEETLKVITNINGYNIDTLNDVIYSETSYNDMEQCMKEYEYIYER
jgi:hypothetical protein